MQVNTSKTKRVPPTRGGALVANLLTVLTLLTGCGGGGGGSGGGPVTPPPAADQTFSVTLESIEASDRSNGAAVTVAGGRVTGATTTLQP